MRSGFLSDFNCKFEFFFFTNDTSSESISSDNKCLDFLIYFLIKKSSPSVSVCGRDLPPQFD
jgi:hypothetical protein